MARVYQPRGARGWYVDYRAADGKRIRKRVASDKRTAERILREWVRNAELARAGLAPFATNDVDIWELYDGFRSHLVANGRRPQTVLFYDNRITPLLRFIGAKKVSNVTLDKIDEYKAGRTAAGRAPGTINASIRALRTMFRWAVRYERIARDPLKRVELLENRKVHHRRPLEEDEIAKLLEASPSHYRRIWIAFLTTGLRHKELVELRWRDVDLDSRLLRVAAENCKLRREDLLPMALELEAVLRELMPGEHDPDARVFLNAAGRPWRHNLLKRFKSCLRTAGIDPDGLDIHSLRQTFGTRLASDPTVDVKSVQTLMRHRTIAMTMQVYVKPRAIRLRQAMKNLSLPYRKEEDRIVSGVPRRAAAAAAR